MDNQTLEHILESLLFAASPDPLTPAKMQHAFLDDAQPTQLEIESALVRLADSLSSRAIHLHQVAGGYRIQIRPQYAPFVEQLLRKKPPKYSRALLETLALIAYRQPITRAEVEAVRGVAVSTQILKTLQDREWVAVSGYRDLPGKPALWVTTDAFLNDFNLRHCDELPPLPELIDLSKVDAQLALGALPEQLERLSDGAVAADKAQVSKIERADSLAYVANTLEVESVAAESLVLEPVEEL
jgi:segregation and condensation protein B